ncbi:hypothetical protein [Symbiobacterium thermophilum]|uniref:hypothetical protein n=1 Tax=Symbiobacterium thermophilum TaxID=2734 RepID=UPI00030709F8|nr:hypothetical protein [Symbiobacterium thermophilum]
MIRTWVMAAALVLVTALAGVGVTFALFTDSREGGSHELVAGTVRIDGERVNDTVRGPMFYIDGASDGVTHDGQEGLLPTGLWAPGDAHHRGFQIENVGTLDVKLTGMTAELKAGDEVLAGALDVKIYDDLYLDEDGHVLNPEATLIYSGKLAEFLGSGMSFPTPIELAPGDLASIGILVSFPLDAGDAYQGTTIKVTFSAHAEQLRNN